MSAAEGPGDDEKVTTTNHPDRQTVRVAGRQRFLLSPEKRRFDRGGLPGVDVSDEKNRERERAQQVRDAARLATLWMRDLIRAIEDLDYVDRVGFLSEGADRLEAVAAQMNVHMERLQLILRTVLDAAGAPAAGGGSLRGRECSKGGILDPVVAAALNAAEESWTDLSATRRVFDETVETYRRRLTAEGLTGNAALRTEPDVPKPGQHLKSRPSGKPAGPSDRHGGALNPTAAPDGSGPGGGG